MINNVVTLLPSYIENNVALSTLSGTDTSLIMAMFSVAQIIFAPFNGSIKNWLGSKNTIVVGFILLTVTTVGLGLIANITDPTTFKIVACTIRFFQGQGDIMLQITGYSVITAIYADDMMRYIGYIEICVGVGLGLGPTLASLIMGLISSDSNVSYPYTMYVFGGFDLIALSMCVFMIPQSLNQTISEEEIQQIEFEEDL